MCTITNVFQSCKNCACWTKIRAPVQALCCAGITTRSVNLVENLFTAVVKATAINFALALTASGIAQLEVLHKTLALLRKTDATDSLPIILFTPHYSFLHLYTLSLSLTVFLSSWCWNFTNNTPLY